MASENPRRKLPAMAKYLFGSEIEKIFKLTWKAEIFKFDYLV